MMKKYIPAVLLLSLACSASAEDSITGVEPQLFELPLGILPGIDSTNFFCDAKPSVSSVTFTSNHVNVTGFINGGITLTGSNTSNILNQVYFTASTSSFTGAALSIDVVYLGSKDDVICYEGKGNRSIEFSGQ